MYEQREDDARMARRNYLFLCIGATVAMVLIIVATIVLV